MICQLKNIQELESKTITLEQGDSIVLDEPSMRFYLSDNGNELWVETQPCSASLAHLAIDVALKKFKRHNGCQNILKSMGKTIEFECTSRHPNCPKRKDGTAVLCTADITTHHKPECSFPWLLCKMPCGAYFDTMLMHKGTNMGGFSKPMSEYAGLGDATVRSLSCAISTKTHTKEFQES